MLNVLSVCRLLPTPHAPSQGIFVERRLQGMQAHANVERVQPIAYFPGVKPLPEWAHSDGGCTKRIPMFYLPGILKSADAWWMTQAIVGHIKQAHARKPIDIIDAHWGYPEAVACRAISKKLGIPYSVTLRGHEVDYLADPHFGPRLLEAFHDATLCICVSQSLADAILARGIPEEKVIVIHNAVDLECFRPGSKAATRAELNLADDQHLIFCAAQILPGKRILDLLDTMVHISKVDPAAHLLIAGSLESNPAYVARVKDGIRAHSLESRVTLLGPVQPRKLVQFYQAADVFCLLTEREGCCNAVLEALACGLPVVTTPAGDNAFFVNNEKNGYIVNIGDTKEAASKVSRLFTQPISADRVSQSLKVGNWSQVGKKVIEAMNTSLSQNAIAGKML